MSDGNRALPASLTRNPELDRWVRVLDGGRIRIVSGKVELGQGILTALIAIAADELDVAPSRIELAATITGQAPNEMLTAGSRSIEDSGAALRQACAQARLVMLEKAAQRLGVAVASLSVDDGLIQGPGVNEALSYWDLQAEQPFELTIETPVPEKPVSQYRWVGKGLGRVDLPAKVRGAAAFVHDLAPEGVLHARVVRPPTYHHRLVQLDERQLRVDPRMKALVRDGSFLAVIAEDEAAVVALAAKAARAATWRAEQPLADGDVRRWLAEAEPLSFPLQAGQPQKQPVPDWQIPQGTLEVRAEYFRPYTMHASLAPSAAMALWRDDQLQVWSHSQGVEVLRGVLAKLLGLRNRQVQVTHVQGAGAYGHNGADDAAVDAALCARACPGHPVLLKWTRSQEHQWEPYGPAALFDMRGALDADGRIQAWSHEVRSFTHSGRPMAVRDGLDAIAAWHLAEPFAPSVPAPGMGRESGIHRNAWPLYALPSPRVIKHFVKDSPLRTSSLRGLGAQANVFAIESFMDELAEAAGIDPVVFRLRHLEDVRAREVLNKVVTLAGGGLGRAAAREQDGVQIGRGLALAQYKNQQTYAAVIVEVAVNSATAAIQARRMWIAADAGLVVDPDGLINQLEGGAVQSLSWALKEAVRFNPAGIESVDWESYPILRFSEVPGVETVLIDRPDQPSLGAGEATQGPASGAVANAVYAATGLRVRELPITPERLRQAAMT
jgi:nicotinate dehydrogenase subunit B